MSENFGHLINIWIDEMQRTPLVYRDPVLDEKTVSIIKLICDTFKQHSQVFFMTVDVIEKYIYLKDYHQERIADPFLIACVIILIISKYDGGMTDLKVHQIEILLLKVTGINYNYQTILNAEKEILYVLQSGLPLSTTLDELETFLEKVCCEYNLQNNLKPLCGDILLLIYCTKQRFIDQLKHIYKYQMNTFDYLMSSKLYFPLGIFVVALKTTNYQFIMNIDGLMKDLKVFANILPDDINILASVIINLMQ